MKNKLIIVLLLFVASSCNKVKDGADVINLMKEKYNNSYFQNFTFSQNVYWYENDSIVRESVWHEAYSSPNKLIIKFDSLNSGAGYIFKQDTVFIMENNLVKAKQRDIHDLLILGFDIYEEPSEVTYNKLIEKGYDLSKVCETKIEGKEAYCVGVENEAEEKNKFYIDKENLVFLKMVNYTHSRYDEAMFTNYKMIKGNYIATRVFFYDEGKIIMSEDYFDIDFPEKIDAKIFDYRFFKEAQW